ncbi:ShlB/FhaC/HecB family hemolysin secretion/activation protein [Kalamiella sp. sgz302252]|uniref:ShlB/FhaC/HecB family hemolysin secretion/activation protein n=1 Tax=Pantoea sp. sgz302252 TaxID=3341827 RepID=UPI0036D3B359
MIASPSPVRAGFGLLTAAFTLSAFSAQPQNEPLILQRQQALEQQLLPSTPDVRLASPTSTFGRLRFPQENPCFTLSRVTLAGRENLPRWLPLQAIANQATGKCLGGKGINLLMSALQNRLIDHGYITTRVLAPSQDLKSGELKLTLLPGKVHEVMLTPESNRYLTLYSVFPVHSGQLLDLRDIEQGLENLQRLPTVQASMEIVPGKAPGESDVQLRRQQSKMWRIEASLDDSGTRETGRYQGSLTLSLDNPLSLSDIFYFSAGSGLVHHGDKGTRNFTGHYSLPLGYWNAGVTANSYDYHQNVAGLTQDYRYSGKSQNLSFQLSRVLHRSDSQKTSFSWEVLARETRNYINDTEVEVQRRRTAAWRLGLQHRHYLPWTTLDVAVSYQRGTRWFGALPAPEEYFGEATALAKILQYSAQLETPFTLGGQRFRHSLRYLRQTSNTPLTPQDKMAIGSRWTVRGFNGEYTLNADNAWYLRNELGWSLPVPAQELYLGVDYGETGGRSKKQLIGNHLAGGALGLCGQAWRFSYDLFAAMPFSKPDGFRTDPVSLGFTVNWQY